MKRREFSLTAASALAMGALSLPAVAQPREGKDYRKLAKPVATDAPAGKVEVNIRNGQDFEMDIVDDGYGFDQSALAARQARHVGLSIMLERATRIAATVDIMSRPGEGTRVSLVLPHKERALA